MAHFAQIDGDGVVLQVIVVSNDVIQGENERDRERIGIAFCKSLYGDDTNWVQTSYNNNFRVRFAGIGMKYDKEKDEFVYPPAVDPREGGTP